MKNIARPWMLTYAVFYGLFSAFAVLDNVQEHYPVPFTIWSVIYYLLVFTGNLIYSLDAITLPVRKIWKSVFPIIIAGYFLGSAIDLSYGKHAHRLTISLIIIGLIVDLAVFFPTFWAHYKIGYGKEADTEDQ